MHRRLVVDTAALPALLGLLDAAERRVDLIAYSFALTKQPSAPQQVLQALLDAHGRGVAVRVYLEGERETALRNVPTGELLAVAGIDVVYGATHAKGVAVDDAVFFGSTNLTNQSLTKNIEANVVCVDDDDVCAGFDAYFAHLWRGGRHGGVTLPPPLYADGDFAAALVDVIDDARASVDFAIYFFDQEDIERALARAARRGVVVRGLAHTHNSFALPYVRRTRRTVERLQRAGVDVHLGPPSLFSHAKLLVRDQRALFIGTGNWLDEDIDTHPQLAARFDDAVLARAAVAWLTTTIRERTTPLSPSRTSPA